MKTNLMTVCACFLVTGVPVLVGACSGSRTEAEYVAFGDERCKACGATAQCNHDEPDASRADSSGETHRAVGEPRSKEPHPQSPYYRGKEMEKFVRIAGTATDGKIAGASSEQWTDVVAYDSSGTTKTPLQVLELGSDTCMKDAQLHQVVKVPPPLYKVRNASGLDLCDEVNRELEGDALKCHAEHAAVQLHALALPGYWSMDGVYHKDSTSFTLACMGGVAAKCAHWGYVPWQGAYMKTPTSQPKDLLPYYKACVHAARADYGGEGDGRHHTCGSTEIDIYDNIGIADRAKGTRWDFEAAWTEDKAACASRARYDMSSVGKNCLGDYTPVVDCEAHCEPGKDKNVLVCNRVDKEKSKDTPSHLKQCPTGSSADLVCKP